MMELSISRINLFKACRRKYQLKYIEGVEPLEHSDALETGKSYHAMIDAFYKGEEVPETFTKAGAMFEAYKKHIVSAFKVVASEQKITKELLGLDVTFIGIADGIAEDGYLVEHKTTSAANIEEYEYNLQWDEQILAYMWLSGKRKMWYTVIKKPTIRQKQNETDEEFYCRIIEWYDVDTDTKIKVLEIERTEDEISQFWLDLSAMACEIKYSDKSNGGITGYYRNTCNCQAYGTRCEYAPICLDYDPDQEYVGFTKKEKNNEFSQN